MEEFKKNFEKAAQTGITVPGATLSKQIPLFPALGDSFPSHLSARKPDLPLSRFDFLHGGGFVIASINTHETICHELCVLTGIRYCRWKPAPRRSISFRRPAGRYTAFYWVYHNHHEPEPYRPDRIALFRRLRRWWLAACLPSCQDLGGPQVAWSGPLYPMTDFTFREPLLFENASGYSL